MSVTCEPSPTPCTSVFISPPSTYRFTYACRGIDMAGPISILEADLLIDRSVYASIPCNCIEEYGYIAAYGMGLCDICDPPAPALICEFPLCGCIIDPALSQSMSNATLIVADSEEEFFSQVLACAIDIDPNIDITLIGNGIFRLTNFRELINPDPAGTIINVDETHGTALFNINTSRLLTFSEYEIKIINDRVPWPCCDGNKTASISYYILIIACIRLRNFDITPYVNTKEDSEVLKGLFIGRYMHEQFHDEHIIKRAKTIDIV